MCYCRDVAQLLALVLLPSQFGRPEWLEGYIPSHRNSAVVHSSFDCMRLVDWSFPQQRLAVSWASRSDLDNCNLGPGASGALRHIDSFGLDSVLDRVRVDLDYIPEPGQAGLDMADGMEVAVVLVGEEQYLEGSLEATRSAAVLLVDCMEAVPMVEVCSSGSLVKREVTGKLAPGMDIAVVVVQRDILVEVVMDTGLQRMLDILGVEELVRSADSLEEAGFPAMLGPVAGRFAADTRGSLVVENSKVAADLPLLIV